MTKPKPSPWLLKFGKAIKKEIRKEAKKPFNLYRVIIKC